MKSVKALCVSADTLFFPEKGKEFFTPPLPAFLLLTCFFGQAVLSVPKLFVIKLLYIAYKHNYTMSKLVQFCNLTKTAMDILLLK